MRTKPLQLSNRLQVLLVEKRFSGKCIERHLLDDTFVIKISLDSSVSRLVTCCLIWKVPCCVCMFWCFCTECSSPVAFNSIYAYYCLYPSTHQSSLMDVLIFGQSPGPMPVNSRVDYVPVSHLVIDKISFLLWYILYSWSGMGYMHEWVHRVLVLIHVECDWPWGLISVSNGCQLGKWRGRYWFHRIYALWKCLLFW